MTDPTRISDDQHNNAPAVPQGWKLVPIEPTKEMLDAGLKRKAQARWIDGASVLRSRNENLRPAEEIAALQWEAMLATTPAPAPAQEVGLTDEMIAAGGRALCDISADACNVDRDDNWALHSEFYKSDAHACIIAALRAKGGK